jgi:hypothetical protein
MNMGTNADFKKLTQARVNSKKHFPQYLAQISRRLLNNNYFMNYYLHVDEEALNLLIDRNDIEHPMNIIFDIDEVISLIDQNER